MCQGGGRPRVGVALLTEGVGRNVHPAPRKAVAYVALLTEGVGRNIVARDAAVGGHLSPSSRRAWVEIGGQQAEPEGNFVALLTEGVGRNQNYGLVASAVEGRPPRGGRG